MRQGSEVNIDKKIPGQPINQHFLEKRMKLFDVRGKS